LPLSRAVEEMHAHIDLDVEPLHARQPPRVLDVFLDLFRGRHGVQQAPRLELDTMALQLWRRFHPVREGLQYGHERN
jgi:hypothetical protein